MNSKTNIFKKIENIKIKEGMLHMIVFVILKAMWFEKQFELQFII